MSNRNAQVASGARGPIAKGESVQRDAAALVSGYKQAEPLKDGYKRYRAKVSGYRLQITSPPDTHDLQTGRVLKHARKTAQFTSIEPIDDGRRVARGELVTNDPLTIETLEKSRYFNVDFWLAEKQDQEIATRKLDDLERAIAALPAGPLQQEFMERMNARVAANFQLPPTQMPSAGA